MANFVGTTSDYTKLGKEYALQSQDKTLWEQFFTGLTEKYDTLGEQTTAAYEAGVEQTKQAYSYDISKAYANYKKQQLSLQMNQQLGEGFKQQVGSDLFNAYEETYSGLRREEASDISTLGGEYESAVLKLGEAYSKEYAEGEKEFTKLGSQLRNYDKLIREFGTHVGKEMPTNAYKTTTDPETGENIFELTDEGRLWYHDVLNATTSDALTFDDWLLSEEFGSEDVSYEDRVALWETYGKNPDLFRRQVAGFTSDFDAEKTKTRLEEEKRAVEEAAVKAEYQTKAAELENSFKNVDNMVKYTGVGRSDKNFAPKINKNLTEIVNGYIPNSGAKITTTSYDSHTQRQHSTVKIKDSVLNDSQRKAIRDNIGYYADAYLKNGEWTIYLSNDGKIYAGQHGMSYSEFINALKKE